MASKKAPTKKFKILIDNREKTQYRYTFDPSWYCDGCIATTLETGDYTIVGHETEVCIERKRCVAEIAQNFNEDRFYRELERMRSFKWAYILCEFSMKDLYSFPEGADLPPTIKKKIKANGSYLLKKVSEAMITYPNVHFLFCGSQYHAYVTLVAIFKRVHESAA
jgi:glucosamine 6-phosphate synthetase-like amidotransferase/phosphosugar isomerase protein